MRNHTGPYSSRPKPTRQKPKYRKVTGSQLPSGRLGQQRRSGNMYLKHSQGFGGRRRTSRGGNSRHDSHRVYALIVVGCALLLFVASILWYVNRSVDITLNGQSVSVRIHSTVAQLIEDEELVLKPGNLLAVDDSVLEKGAGTVCTVIIDDKKIKNADLDVTEFEGGEDVTIDDGEDLYEKHEVQATPIQPELTMKGSGPVRFVETWGEAGRTEVWVGERTGLTVDRGQVKDPVDCVVSCSSVTPDVDDGKYVALTFDEGPSARTEDILAILKEKSAKATFFVSGDKVAGNESAVKAIADSGNELGTNAYSDTMLTELPAADLRTQLSRSFDAVKGATGTAVSMVRPPYGEFSAQNWADAMDLVSVVITWNIDSGDWLLQGAQSVADTVVASVGNGSIALLTDNDATAGQTVEALPMIIDRLQNEGYTFVTISELIKTDEDLADLVFPNKATMPKKAAMPKLPADDATSEA